MSHFGPLLSMFGLVRDLEWQSLKSRRKNARLALFYKVFMAFLQFHATHFAGLFVTSETLDSDTFTIRSSRLDCYK